MNLKHIREKLQLKQSDLAEKIGITSAYYSMIETKKRRPSVEVARKIAIVLGFPNNWSSIYSDYSKQEPTIYKTKRLAANLTIPELVLLTNISKRNYIDIENGTRPPTSEEQSALRLILK